MLTLKIEVLLFDLWLKFLGLHVELFFLDIQQLFLISNLLFQTLNLCVQVGDSFLLVSVFLARSSKLLDLRLQLIFFLLKTIEFVSQFNDFNLVSLDIELRWLVWHDALVCLEFVLQVLNCVGQLVDFNHVVIDLSLLFMLNWIDFGFTFLFLTGKQLLVFSFNLFSLFFESSLNLILGQKAVLGINLLFNWEITHFCD